MTTKFKPKDFRVKRGPAVNLDRLPTAIDPFYASKEGYQATLQRQVAKLLEQQELLYASDCYALSYPETREERRKVLAK